MEEEEETIRKKASSRNQMACSSSHFKGILTQNGKRLGQRNEIVPEEMF